MKNTVSRDITALFFFLLKMRILLFAILVASSHFTGKTDAACKAHDASWNRGVTPRVTQPARSEPEKVVLDWNSAIHNARCVDFYNIYGKY